MKRAATLLLAASLLSVPSTADAADRWQHHAQVWAATHPVNGYALTGDVDPWGFDVGTCISYVAWWENAHRHPIDIDGWWGSASRLLSDPPIGWTVNTSPRLGDVVVWLPDQILFGSRTSFAGPTGHVGIVTWIYRDGSLEVAQYNVDGQHSWTPGRFFSSGHYLRPVPTG